MSGHTELGSAIWSFLVKTQPLSFYDTQNETYIKKFNRDPLGVKE